MGFYFKKSINFGPIKINFSKSGFSLSFGVKGAKVNVNKKRSQVHIGKNGIYYKKNADNKKIKSLIR